MSTMIVLVKFEEAEYSVREDEGLMEACVNVTGEITEQIQLRLYTVDITATSE